MAPPDPSHRTDKQGRRLCAAHTTAGNECRQPAIRGGRVCKVHGGSAPQVIAAAKRRLLELVDPAITVLARSLVEEEASQADKIRAAREILDRAGLPAVTRAEVTGPGGEPFHVVMSPKLGSKKKKSGRDASG